MFITLIIINNLFEDITLVLCKLFFVILLNSLYLSKYKYVLISVHLIYFYKYALSFISILDLKQLYFRLLTLY